MLNKLKSELINNAKAKFMEEYFILNQSLKAMTNKKDEEYEKASRRVDTLEHNMHCLEELLDMISQKQI